MKICADCVFCERKGSNPIMWECNEYVTKERIHSVSGETIKPFVIKMNCYMKNPSGECSAYKER